MRAKLDGTSNKQYLKIVVSFVGLLCLFVGLFVGLLLGCLLGLVGIVPTPVLLEQGQDDQSYYLSNGKYF